MILDIQLKAYEVRREKMFTNHFRYQTGMEASLTQSRLICSHAQRSATLNNDFELTHVTAHLWRMATANNLGTEQGNYSPSNGKQSLFVRKLMAELGYLCEHNSKLMRWHLHLPNGIFERGKYTWRMSWKVKQREKGTYSRHAWKASGQPRSWRTIAWFTELLQLFQKHLIADKEQTSRGLKIFLVTVTAIAAEGRINLC